MASTMVRIVGPALVDQTTETIYTTPAETKTVVRHIHVFNPTAGTVNFTLSIGADGAATRLFDAKPITTKESFDHFGIYPLAAAEIIAANASTDDELVITITAEVITL